MSKLYQILRKLRFYLAGLVFLLIILFYFSLPERTFNTPYSTVLLDREGNLLNALIAKDGQWRFPPAKYDLTKYREAVLLFEDEYFFSHPGVNPVSVLRALWQNLRAGRVISGGSTLTMQVIRMSRKRPRTIGEKLIEMFLAVRLEFRYNKEEVLGLYVTHAPYGGNIVGIGAASWRYFGRAPDELSWAEASLLAVLPNSPGLIHPGKNRAALKEKRDKLLDKLLSKETIDTLTHKLAKQEPLPEGPGPFPNMAPHLLTRALNDGQRGRSIRTSLSGGMQRQVSQILQRASEELQKNEIHNLAALVTDVRTGKTLAYCGNVKSGSEHGMDVDIINAPRSTGSILKPFLYAAIIEEGLLMPHALLPDVPLYLDGFAPKNFSGSWEGAVPADEALARSLNLPAVFLLRKYRYEKFHSILIDLGMTTLFSSPDRYGLSLVLGGAEGTLWDIVSMYQDMAGKLEDVQSGHGNLTYYKDTRPDTSRPYPLSKGPLWHTVNALTMLARPGSEGNWRSFGSSYKIAWKTGTSFGNRDAWSVGITPEYCIGVWVGNADGEGRPGLTGIDTAAPVLFDIFNGLERSPSWFNMPVNELTEIGVCGESGERASRYCENITNSKVFKACLRNTACGYHTSVNLDKTGKFRVNSDCASPSNMEQKNWFVLPGVQEYYYRQKHSDYEPLPPFKKGCGGLTETHPPIVFVYPKPGTKIYIPKELTGAQGKALFEAAHSDPGIEMFWHINDEYLGATKGEHKLEADLQSGEYTITIVDNQGNSASCQIEVLSR